ncbi:hypothetical protein APHAL10511_003047 [Amanita phalloides]|nr:hypothetical protein APHAL10511_003047 [Amanita phalloides]
MWQLSTVINPIGSQLWFSDGLPLNQSRGGNGSSCRLIVNAQGFLDITELQLGSRVDAFDFNGYVCATTPDYLPDKITRQSITFINIDLTLPGDETFVITCKTTRQELRTSGPLKSLPTVSKTDVEFLDKMINQKYVPYQNIPDAPEKTTEELQKLGKQYFPYSPYSFQLAMAVYDWTTASFARMVFNKVFEYTGIPTRPFPLDEKSIALMIWESNWNTYNPKDPDYMNSFMMKPAPSLADVESQLTSVRDHLHEFSAVQNRLMAAALQVMPRTSLVAKSRLFSGQVDIYQMGLDRFGIEFLQCTMNTGPVGEALIMAFASVMSSYVSEGKVITTKMVWSFTDSVQDALHYQNGILLVANPPEDDSWVWEAATYITSLSDDPKKTEYIFAPGTSFLVQRIDEATVGDKQVVVINLQPVTPAMQREKKTFKREFEVAPLPLGEIITHVASYSPELENQVEIISTDGIPQYKIAHKTRGRRCQCVNTAERLINAGERVANTN